MKATLFDDRRCLLGEGIFWHPARQQLFWFDIIGQRLMTVEGGRQKTWRFERPTSAMGWIDEDTMILADSQSLSRFSLLTGARESLAPLEADLPGNRSNDGRADPHGGFWIGTMSLSFEPGAGSFWRYYRGELRRIVPDITVTNACCFSVDGLWAYFTDSRRRVIMRLPLSEADGWPAGEAEPWLDLSGQGFNPDGAVIAADGTFWNAQWGASRVAQYGPGGALLQTIEVPAAQSSCPAFGGPDLTTLYCTTAAHGDPDPTPDAGCTFVAEGLGPGQAEHRVIL